MLNIGTPELLVILIIALLVVGPQRLPELSRQLGRGLREFRKIQDDVKDMVKVDLDTPDALPPSAPAGSPMAPGVHRTRRPASTDGAGVTGNGADGNGAPRDGHVPPAG
jgi:Tat protein translocase TatB subunit